MFFSQALSFTDLYVTSNGRISDSNDLLQSGVVYRVEPRLCGGKGGNWMFPEQINTTFSLLHLIYCLKNTKYIATMILNLCKSMVHKSMVIIMISIKVLWNNHLVLLIKNLLFFQSYVFNVIHVFL